MSSRKEEEQRSPLLHSRAREFLIAPVGYEICRLNRAAKEAVSALREALEDQKGGFSVPFYLDRPPYFRKLEMPADGFRIAISYIDLKGISAEIHREEVELFYRPKNVKNFQAFRGVAAIGELGRIRCHFDAEPHEDRPRVLVSPRTGGIVLEDVSIEDWQTKKSLELLNQEE